MPPYCCAVFRLACSMYLHVDAVTAALLTACMLHQEYAVLHAISSSVLLFSSRYAPLVISVSCISTSMSAVSGLSELHVIGAYWG